MKTKKHVPGFLTLIRLDFLKVIFPERGSVNFRVNNLNDAMPCDLVVSSEIYRVKPMQFYIQFYFLGLVVYFSGILWYGTHTTHTHTYTQIYIYIYIYIY